MTVWLEKKYINLVGQHLRNFKWRGSHSANASCPICGDSTKVRTKARFFFLESGQHYNVYCHNCGFSSSFASFLRTYYPTLSREFWFEHLRETGNTNTLVTHTRGIDIDVPKLIISKSQPVVNATKISQLQADHYAKKYVVKRKIPNPYHSRLYFVEHFMRWINENYIAQKFAADALKHDGPRLVIPFFDKQGNMVACQGRALNNDPLRYISIVFDDTRKIAVFNGDIVDFDKQYFVFEGPIDAMFVANSVAIGGSSASLIYDLPNVDTNAVIVYDNDKRNKDVVRQINKTIDRGLSVFIWPDDVVEKDINELACNGMTFAAIKQLIVSNVYKGLAAKARLAMWSKV